ncbi:MAG: CBS domain-containing protein [Deltaproteobacteria bacterium]|nr:CBS domain-containing protein [Deltaproteobacteria bacterium]MBT4528093.1 CBS domain-containing protein [Deltaproteobacteria bacterium]
MSQAPIVADYMDTKFFTLNPNNSVNEAINLLKKNHLIAVMVLDDEDKNKVIGLLSERDCLKLILDQTYNQLPKDNVSNLMQKCPEPVSSSMLITEVVEIFFNNSFRRMPVIDNGILVGQITRRDVLRGLHHLIFK